MDFREIHTDTHSCLMTKVDKFKPSKNKKAYSYFGTICKNYLMGQIIKDQKDMNRKISYEDISTDLQNNPEMVYYIDNEDITTEEIILKFKDRLLEIMDDTKISDQEKKLGQAISELFDNYKSMIPDSNNNKFNKNVILFELREMTNLSTKEIRNSMKRYKKIYTDLLQDILKD
jgi:molybdopterin converting factor small subunit